MKTILINILAVLGGLVIGSALNMGLIMTGSFLIPAPAGVDVSSMESLSESMHLFQPRHFLFPFLAHAIGTLVGALFACKIARSRRLLLAMLVSTFFLAGGIANTMILPAPLWFDILDLIAAYLPMGLLAYKLVLSFENNHAKNA